MKKFLKIAALVIGLAVVAGVGFVVYSYVQVQEKYKETGNPRYRG